MIWLSWKQHSIVCVYTHIAFIILSGEDYNICFHLEIPPTVPTMMAKVWTTYIVDTIQTDDLWIQRKWCLLQKMQKCLCDGIEYSASIKVIMSVSCMYMRRWKVCFVDRWMISLESEPPDPLPYLLINVHSPPSISCWERKWHNLSIPAAHSEHVQCESWFTWA